MADLKISQLTGASTPLAGTEVLPIVQSGSTVKVSVANLTAGRAVASAGGTFSDNFVQGTAAKGINFTANTPAAGMTSELLNWYEEGTWTPADNSGAGLTFSNSYGSYTRVGRMVFAQVLVIYPTTANTNSSRIGGLPFTVADSNGVYSPSRSGASVTFSDAGVSMYGLLSQGTTEFYLFNQTTAANVTNATLSGKAVRLMFAYPV